MCIKILGIGMMEVVSLTIEPKLNCSNQKFLSKMNCRHLMFIRGIACSLRTLTEGTLDHFSGSSV